MSLNKLKPLISFFKNVVFTLTRFVSISIILSSIALVLCDGDIKWRIRCTSAYQIEGTLCDAQCWDGKLICLCPCGNNSSQVAAECCPPNPPYQNKALNLEQKPIAPTSLQDDCILFKEFDCFEKVTEYCKNEQIILKNNTFYATKTYEDGIRSYSVPSWCVLKRQIVDSMCPMNQTETVLRGSGNIHNTMNINKENYACKCGDSPSPTNKPIPDNKTFGIVLSVSIFAAIILLSVVLIAVKSGKIGSQQSNLECRIDEGPLLTQDTNSEQTSEIVENHQPENVYWKSRQTLKILEPIDKGGYGYVFSALNTEIQKSVAIKRIKISCTHELLDSLVREVSSLVKLRSPHVVKLYKCWIEDEFGNDVGLFDSLVNLAAQSNVYQSSTKAQCQTLATTGNNLFLEMELCHFDLHTWLTTCKTMEERENAVRDIFLHVITGLEAVHDKQIIHRDIKPKNILCQITPEKEFIWKIADLGLSREITGIEAKAPFSQVGTFDYRSPEMLEGLPYTAKTDVFSLGLTFVEVLSPSLIDSQMKNICFNDIRRSVKNNWVKNVALPFQSQVLIIRRMLARDEEKRPNIWEAKKMFNEDL